MESRGFGSWAGRDIRVDFSALPQTVDLSPSRVRAWFFIVFGLIWCPGMWAAFERIQAPDRTVALVFAAGAAIGLLILASGLLGLSRRNRAILHGDGVTVERRGPLGTRSRFMPYAEFQGVGHRELVVPRHRPDRISADEPPIVIQIVELLHAERERSIPLLARQTETDPRQDLEAYARRLRLPVLEVDRGSPTGFSARRHSELDTPLGDRVRDGSPGSAAHPAMPPPPGLAVRDEAGITISVRRMPLWFFAFFIGPGLGIAGFAVLTDWLSSVLSASLVLIGLAFVGFALTIIVFDWSTPRLLRFEGGRIAVEDSMTPDREGLASMAFEEIESITIARDKSNLGDAVVISGDRGKMYVGLGLSRPALVWLKGYLTATIATA